MGLGRAASWINLVLELAGLGFIAHLMVSEGVTATVASTIPAPRPASMVRPGLSFPYCSVTHPLETIGVNMPLDPVTAP